MNTGHTGLDAVPTLIIAAGGITATRRTTMSIRSGSKLHAVRDKAGKFKDIQTYKRAHTADMRHKSKPEKAAARGHIETQARKTADDGVKSVTRSVRGAVAAVERAAREGKRALPNIQPIRIARIIKLCNTGQSIVIGLPSMEILSWLEDRELRSLR